VGYRGRGARQSYGSELVTRRAAYGKRLASPQKRRLAREALIPLKRLKLDCPGLSGLSPLKVAVDSAETALGVGATKHPFDGHLGTSPRIGPLASESRDKA
jgi:hypothetical protein